MPEKKRHESQLLIKKTTRKNVVAGVVYSIQIILIIAGKLFNLDNTLFVLLLLLSVVIQVFSAWKFFSGTGYEEKQVSEQEVRQLQGNNISIENDLAGKTETCNPGMAADYPISIVEYDLNDRITYLNQDAKTLFSIDDNDIARGINIYDGIHSDEKEKVKMNIDKLKNGGTTGLTKYRMRLKNSRIVSSLARSIGLYENGHLVGIRSIIFEIEPGFQLILLPSDDFCRKYDISEREKEVIELFMKGFTYNVIAEKLFISYKTVDKHICNIYHKTTVNSRSQLIELLEKEP